MFQRGYLGLIFFFFSFLQCASYCLDFYRHAAWRSDRRPSIIYSPEPLSFMWLMSLLLQKSRRLYIVLYCVLNRIRTMVQIATASDYAVYGIYMCMNLESPEEISLLCVFIVLPSFTPYEMQKKRYILPMICTFVTASNSHQTLESINRCNRSYLVHLLPKFFKAKLSLFL